MEEPATPAFDPRSLFGQIDIYLFDQILRGRIVAGDRIFDAGCGAGRNIEYLLRAGYEVAGVDADPDAIDEARALAAAVAPRCRPTASARNRSRPPACPTAGPTW